MSPRTKMERRFYWAMRLILAGLVVELVSLLGLHHPLGFMVFAGVGCTLMGAGIVLFLVTFLSLARTPDSDVSG